MGSSQERPDGRGITLQLSGGIRSGCVLQRAGSELMLAPPRFAPSKLAPSRSALRRSTQVSRSGLALPGGSARRPSTVMAACTSAARTRKSGNSSIEATRDGAESSAGSVQAP
jgi:hypothetical protein